MRIILQLKIKMESALTRIESFFSQSSTIEEMEIYIDEIKKIEGVEEVWGSQEIEVQRYY